MPFPVALKPGFSRNHPDLLQFGLDLMAERDLMSCDQSTRPAGPCAVEISLFLHCYSVNHRSKASDGTWFSNCTHISSSLEKVMGPF